MNIIYKLAFSLLFLFPFAFNQAWVLQQTSNLPKCKQIQKKERVATANIIFKSTDGGQTWQDISKGLPENVEESAFFANETGLYLRAGNVLFHSKPSTTTSFWEKEIFLFPGKQGGIAPAKKGIVAYNFNGQFLHQIKGKGTWRPLYTNFRGKEVRTVFETAGGTVFIAANNQLFKSSNGGQTWKPLSTGGPVMKIAESKGVLLATGAEGILRSTDDGETWKWVIKEGGVGIDVEHIKGGFAAITFSAQSNTRRVRISYDGGNTWQPIDAGLQSKIIIDPIGQPINGNIPAQVTSDSVWHPAETRRPVQVIMDSMWHPVDTGLPVQAFITSIIQVGEDFFCGHPTGIFRSSDKGQTWKLLLPSIKGKVFNLSVSGKVIYAIPRNGGC